MTADNHAITIQLAADYIRDESAKRGMPVSADVSLSIARKLWDFWSRPGGPLRHIPAGEIARRFRERYELPLADIELSITEIMPCSVGCANPELCVDCSDRKLVVDIETCSADGFFRPDQSPSD